MQVERRGQVKRLYGENIVSEGMLYGWVWGGQGVGGERAREKRRELRVVSN